MSFSPELAEIRFGCGLSPRRAPPRSVQAMIDGLAGPDEMAQMYPIDTFGRFSERIVESRQIVSDIQKSGDPDARQKSKKTQKVLRAEARAAMTAWMGQTIVRRVDAHVAFRERLAFFWEDHFTATGKGGLMRRATSPYAETAIRPHLTGHFEELLIAAVTNPLMLHYLDQMQSVGPNSERGLASNGRRGLNENLAREILELHTLGVDGPYTQTAVRELAKLLTGLYYTPQQGMFFQEKRAEPGAETVLGVSFGGETPTLEAVHDGLRSLARHPATARHLARKLAVHFVSDAPPQDLIDAVAKRYNDTGGHLLDVYEALLSHPAAWQLPYKNAKLPFDFVTSACRALDVAPKSVQALNERGIRQNFLTPMVAMGHVWQKPTGPDGLSEEDSVWIAPQSLAARIEWAMQIPQRLRPDLPDPRVFVLDALGPFADDAVRFAAQAAESKPEAIGLVLASPAFQYR